MNFSEGYWIQEPGATSDSPITGQLPLPEWYRPTSPEERIYPLPQNGREVKIVFRDRVPYLPSAAYGTFGLYRYPANFIP